MIEENYFLGFNGKITKRNSVVEHITKHLREKKYVFIEFFADYSLADVHQCLTDTQLQQIRDGDAILVLSNTHEAFHNIVEPIYVEVVIKLRIPPNNVILMSESAIIDQEVNRIAAKLGLPRIQCEWFRVFEYNLQIYNVTTTSPTLVNKTYEKKFLNLNRRWRLHRPVFVSLLKVHGLLDSGYVSFADADDGKNWDNLWNEVEKVEPSLAKHKDEIVNMPWLYLDTEDLTVNRVVLTPSTYDYYANTYFSIVSETNFYLLKDHPYLECSPGIFASEKTFKPIKMKHPFILLNRPHSLDMLRKIGYQTFDGIIDESYDKEEDDQKRMMMVLEETKRLSSLNTDELTDFLNKARVICEHNYQTLNTKTEWITRL
jgi:hypothetical protein